jgi:hypothetical protein
MRTVALRYGQPELIADLLPVSVDGLMAVATAALGDGRRNRWSAWLAFWTDVAASVLANLLAAEPSVVGRCISAWPAVGVRARRKGYYSRRPTLRRKRNTAEHCTRDAGQAASEPRAN